MQSLGGPEGRRSRHLPPNCSVGGHRQEVWEPKGHLYPVLDVVGPALSSSPTSASSLDGALHDGLGEGVRTHDVAKPCQLPLPGGCQERFLGTHEAFDQAPVSYLVFSVQDVENFPQAFGLDCLDSSLVICQLQSPRLTSIEHGGDNQ